MILHFKLKNRKKPVKTKCNFRYLYKKAVLCENKAGTGAQSRPLQHKSEGGTFCDNKRTAARRRIQAAAADGNAARHPLVQNRIQTMAAVSDGAAGTGQSDHLCV